MNTRITIFFIFAALSMVMIVEMVPVTVERLWPLDSQTCEAEVINSPYEFKCNGQEFEDQPSDFPFKSMNISTPLSVEVTGNVDISKPSIEHYSIELWIYPGENPDGVIFYYYIPTNANKKVRLQMSNNKLQVYRKVRTTGDATYTASKVLSSDTWYHVIVGVGSVGYIYLYIDGVKYVYGTIGNRNTNELQGTILIGGDNDNTGDFTGRIACVGFVWGSREGSSGAVDTLCRTTPWLPPRPTNNLFYNNHLSNPVPLRSTDACTLIQCSYHCLRNTDCFYMFFDETSTTCDTCLLYSRNDNYGSDKKLLYRVKV